MSRLSFMPLLAVLLALCAAASAEDTVLQGPSAKSYLDCARHCEKSFYFSEQSDPNFAQLRNACIEGCAEVVDANMPAYQSCNLACQEVYPYLHGTNAEFAGFQKTCIVGCRHVH
jgi:hypothetical protein